MQLHNLKPIHKPRKKKYIGHGGKRGVYSGRGIKGQKARAGGKFKPIIREIIKKYPKLRGYRFSAQGGSASGGKSKIAVVNLETLEKKFKEEEVISPQTLLEKRIIRRIKGRTPQIKILGEGELTKKLIIEGCQLSKNAKEKIEKAGGAIH